MAVDLPAEFIADRIFLRATSLDGHDLRLCTDSAGGYYMTRSTAERLGLPIDVDDEQSWTTFPPLRPDVIPPPPSRVPVVDEPELSEPLFGDALLGQSWFADRRWIIDYPNERFALAEDDENLDASHAVPLRFQTDGDGMRQTNFATIDADIDGATIPFLFDTGATARLGDGTARGTCFIVHTVLNRWREAHPTWLVREDADSGRESMIEVPEVSIGGHTVGPVWFTGREDRNFHEWMSQWLDRRVEGALGGSLFRYFRLTADYPAATLSLDLV